MPPVRRNLLPPRAAGRLSGTGGSFCASAPRLGCPRDRCYPSGHFLYPLGKGCHCQTHSTTPSHHPGRSGRYGRAGIDDHAPAPRLGRSGHLVGHHHSGGGVPWLDRRQLPPRQILDLAGLAGIAGNRVADGGRCCSHRDCHHGDRRLASDLDDDRHSRRNAILLGPTRTCTGWWMC
jgi:hypothetical protein